ncbi:CBS domain-containing protein [Fusobacterium sp. SB021]|uniref:CBS domain-containing protein n=1 Tax=Fusobacterium sp. SB021 TaxID=2744227 RepID=UPI003CEB8990
MKKVKDVVNRNLITVSPSSSFEEVINIMKKGVGKVPVLENEKVVGIITRDDILVKEGKFPLPPVIAFWEVMITLPGNKEYQEKLNKFSSYKVEDIMSKVKMYSSLEDNLEDVVTEMLNKKISYTLVLENEKLVGIVTKSDLIKHF